MCSGMTVCVATTITKVQTYPCSLPGFSPVPAQADTFPFPLTFSKTWMLVDTWLYFRACVSHWARVCYSLLSNSSGIRSSGVHVSVVTEYVILNRAGLPGNPQSHPWEPSESSLFSFCLFIYLFKLSTGFRDRVFLLSGLFCYPRVRKKTNCARKWILFIVGKSVYMGEKNAFHILSTWWI